MSTVKAIEHTVVVDGETVRLLQGDKYPSSLPKKVREQLEAIDNRSSGPVDLEAPVEHVDQPEDDGQGGDGSDELAKHVADSTIADLLKEVDGDDEAAQRVLDAEQARGDDARSTLVDALQKQLAGGGE